MSFLQGNFGAFPLREILVQFLQGKFLNSPVGIAPVNPFPERYPAPAGQPRHAWRIIVNEASQVGSSGLHLLDVFNVGNHYLVVFVSAPRKITQVVESFLSETNFGSGSRRAAAMIQRFGLSYSCPLPDPTSAHQS